MEPSDNEQAFRMHYFPQSLQAEAKTCHDYFLAYHFLSHHLYCPIYPLLLILHLRKLRRNRKQAKHPSSNLPSQVKCGKTNRLQKSNKDQKNLQLNKVNLSCVHTGNAQQQTKGVELKQIKCALLLEGEIKIQIK